MKDIRLYISTPSNRDHKGLFTTSIVSLSSYLTGNGIKVDGYNMASFFYRGLGQASCISIARQKFVDEMVAGNYTHWLSLDDDMTFPMDIVDRLIVHDKDVVAVNARHKTQNIKGSLTGLNGASVDSTYRTGLEEIMLMGGAIFLMKVDAFRNIPKPHFQVLWSPSHNDYVSEDIHFASLLRANGVKIYCDHDTSKLVGHVGDFEYKWQDPTLMPVENHLKVVA